MIKNIIFDIGGVLAYPKTGHWFITNDFYSIVDKNLIDEDKLKKSLRDNAYLRTQTPKNEKEECEMFSNYYYKVLLDIDYPDLDIASSIANDCVYNDEKFIFYEDVEENLKRLSLKYNLYIISNGWPSSLRILHNIGIDKYFKGIIISSMYSTTKEESLFDIFLDQYKVNPNESIFIDDRNSILDKANEYGFNLLLMDRKEENKPTKFKTIYNLKEINY